MGRAFRRVCLFVCPRSNKKTAWAINTKLDKRIFHGSRSACRGQNVRGQGHTVRKPSRRRNPMLCYLRPLPAWVCTSIRLSMFSCFFLFVFVGRLRSAVDRSDVNGQWQTDRQNGHEKAVISRRGCDQVEWSLNGQLGPLDVRLPSMQICCSLAYSSRLSEDSRVVVRRSTSSPAVVLLYCVEWRDWTLDDVDGQSTDHGHRHRQTTRSSGCLLHLPTDDDDNSTSFDRRPSGLCCTNLP